MSGTTGRLALATIDTDGDDEVTAYRLAINNHASKLDASLMYLAGPLASLPSAGLAGRVYVPNDTAAGILYMDNGTAWVPFGPSLHRVDRSTNCTASPGESIVCTGSTSFTVTAPTNPAGVFQVINAMTGGAVVTVTAGGSTSLYGYGAPAVGSIEITATDWAATFTASDFSGYLITDWFDGLATPWVPLTLASGISAASGQYVPSVRAELGGAVRLKGVLENTSGSGISAITPLATIPSLLRPSVNDVPLPCVTGTGSDNGVLWAQISGAIVLASGTLAASHFVYLDGLTFTTS